MGHIEPQEVFFLCRSAATGEYLEHLHHVRVAEYLCQLERIEAHRIHLIDHGDLLPLDFGFRLCPVSVVECLFKQLRVFLPVLIENVGILVSNHGCLCVTGVTLYGLDVALVQLELVGDTGVPKAVEDDRRQIVLFNQVLQRLPDLCRFARQPNRRCDHKIKIGILVADGFNRCVLLHFPGDEHLSYRFRKENLADTCGRLILNGRGMFLADDISDKQRLLQLSNCSADYV